MTDIVQRMAEDAAVMARLGFIFPPAELNAAIQRIYERERTYAGQVASVWNSVAIALSDEGAQN